MEGHLKFSNILKSIWYTKKKNSQHTHVQTLDHKTFRKIWNGLAENILKIDKMAQMQNAIQG